MILYYHSSSISVDSLTSNTSALLDNDIFLNSFNIVIIISSNSSLRLSVERVLFFSSKFCKNSAHLSSSSFFYKSSWFPISTLLFLFRRARLGTSLSNDCLTSSPESNKPWARYFVMNSLLQLCSFSNFWWSSFSLLPKLTMSS